MRFIERKRAYVKEKMDKIKEKCQKRFNILNEYYTYNTTKTPGFPLITCVVCSCDHLPEGVLFIMDGSLLVFLVVVVVVVVVF
jgi:hypothetical protein